MGSFVSENTPKPAASNDRSTTSQRWCTEKSRIFEIMAGPRSVVVVGFGLAELSLQDERVGHCDLVPGFQASEDLKGIIVGPTDGDIPALEALLGPYEHDFSATDGLDGGFRQPHLDPVLGDLD